MIKINLVKESLLDRKRRLNLESVRRYQARYPDRVKASQNPVKRREAVRRHDQKNRAYRYSAARRYGLTLEQVEKMLTDQSGNCKICKTVLKGGKKQAIDHNHATGVVRGLLCTACNTALGKFKDSPDILELAALYVRMDGVI